MAALSSPSPVPIPLALAAFTPTDWAVLGLYFVGLAASGWYLARRARRTVRSSGDYFLAGRSMPTWAVAVSILATSQSAATVIGVPVQSYTGDLTYLISNVGSVLAAIILAWVLIPRFYAANATTPYELLEARFGPTARKATSWTYLVGRVFASGSRLYIGSLPAAVVVFGDIEPTSVLAAVGIMTAVGIVYTLAGGIRSVIWTDVIQAAVYLGSAVVIIGFLLWSIDAPIGRVLSGLSETPVGTGNKLTLLHTGLERTETGWRIDFSREFTLLTAVTGVCLLAIASHGLDQDQVQRMLTCRNARQSAGSLITGVLIGIPAVLIYLTIGLLLFVYYQRPDLTGRAHAPGESARVMLQFIVDGLPAGLTGLVMAGLFAAGLSTVNSTLNSMSSAFMSDTYRPMRPSRDERHYLLVGRVGVVAAGLLLGGFACGCVFWFPSTGSTLLVFALGVMNFAYAGLLGVFFTAILTRRGSATSALAALTTGFLVVAGLEPALQRSIAGLLIATEGFKPLSIAPQWRLVIGTAAAFGVCVLGTSRPSANGSRGG